MLFFARSACRQPLPLLSALARPRRECVRLAFQYPTGALRLRLLLRTLRTGTATCVAGSALPWQLVTSPRSRRTFLTSTPRPERCCFRKLDPTQAVPHSHSTSTAVTLPPEHLCSFCVGFVCHYP